MTLNMVGDNKVNGLVWRSMLTDGNGHSVGHGLPSFRYKIDYVHILCLMPVMIIKMI